LKFSLAFCSDVIAIPLHCERSCQHSLFAYNNARHLVTRGQGVCFPPFLTLPSFLFFFLVLGCLNAKEPHSWHRGETPRRYFQLQWEACIKMRGALKRMGRTFDGVTGILIVVQHCSVIQLREFFLTFIFPLRFFWTSIQHFVC
jgi:hypothetical protein